MKTTAVKALIAANFAVFILQYLMPDLMEGLFALWPLQAIGGYHLFHVWQIVSYAFLHSTTDFKHILFNMLALWMFGAEVERTVGARRLLACYFASVVTAALSQLFIPVLLGAPPADTVGASGGIFGLLLAYAYLFPRRKVMLLLPPIPMPAWLFATLYAGLELTLGVTGRQSSVAHFAHLGGMVGSAAVIAGWRKWRT